MICHRNQKTHLSKGVFMFCVSTDPYIIIIIVPKPEDEDSSEISSDSYSE
jgi:hypothetical protein